MATGTTWQAIIGRIRCDIENGDKIRIEDLNELEKEIFFYGDESYKQGYDDGFDDSYF